MSSLYESQYNDLDLNMILVVNWFEPMLEQVFTMQLD